MAEVSGAERINVLYLAPWVDLGGSDTNTVDLLRWLDRDRRPVIAQLPESEYSRLATTWGLPPR